MDSFVQWATILSPVIAVIIAIWTSRSSAKETARKIAALEENTNQQVESIKELAKVQMQLSMLQVEKELMEAKTHLTQTTKRANDEEQRNSLLNNFGGFADSFRQTENRKRDFSDKGNFYAKQIETLNSLQNRLAKMYEKIGGK